MKGDTYEDAILPPISLSTAYKMGNVSSNIAKSNETINKT